MNKNIEINNLKITFNKKEGIPAVNNLSVVFEENTITGIIGESGSGKSVLGMSILGLLPSSAYIEGSAIYKGMDLLKLNEVEMRKINCKEIGLIPQNPSDSLNPVLTIGSQIREIFKKHTNLDNPAIKKQVRELLLEFKFDNPDDIIKNYPFQLSGGMKQRIVSIFGIASTPDWIIADEPTKGLDAILRKQVFDLLINISKTKSRSMIIITHDLSLASMVCDKLLVMYNGDIVETGNSEKILKFPEHSYTKKLIDCMPGKLFKEKYNKEPKTL